MLPLEGPQHLLIDLNKLSYRSDEDAVDAVDAVEERVEEPVDAVARL